MKAKDIKLDRSQTIEVKAKYADVLRRLHVCRPCEKTGLKQVLNYYYELLN